jgi:hypothetical protein
VRVYVESNFVLELVLHQAEHEHCLKLLELARSGTVEIALPVFSLFEPHTTLERRRKERDHLRRQVDETLYEIQRSVEYSADASAGAFSALIVKSTNAAAAEFSAIRQELISHATLLPLSRETFVEAANWTELSLPDGLMLASVLLDLKRGGETCFINRNSKDFDEPGIKKALGECRLLNSFLAGRGFVESRLKSSAS